MPSSLVEAKVLAKVRAVLSADGTISGMVGTRVYDAHLSTVGEPVFPAVSLHLLDGAPPAFLADLTSLRLQVDCWFPVEDQVKSRLYDCLHAMRRALHGYRVSDGTVRILQMVESPSGAIQFEEDRRLWHAAKVYDVIAM